ncbi:MAG TPA: 50S ribosomal protein L21e [Thermoplasmata archaeon]|nr:50S ribosomal protein L21e [Thermoplasmata archaeon]
MVQRSKGRRYRTRQKLQKRKRDRGMPPLTRSLQQFSAGDRVNVVIDPSVHKGQPHHRFHGLTGIVTKQCGRAYYVELKSGKKMKTIIARPEHLRPVKN